MEDDANALVRAVGLMLSGDPELMAIVWLSLRVSLAAAIIGCCLGVPLGAFLVMHRFPGRGAILAVVHALMGLPPVVAGLLVYLLLSRSGPLGPLGLLFTPTAMVMAQSVLTTPIAAALAYRLFTGLWAELGEPLRIDGASDLRAGQVLIAASGAALVTVFLAAFGRAIAEVGAIILVGGNIRHHTRSMTTAIVLETSKGDLPLALALGIMLLAIVLAVNALALQAGRRTA
jgi:tungstate transport system permease protein